MTIADLIQPRAEGFKPFGISWSGVLVRRLILSAIIAMSLVAVPLHAAESLEQWGMFEVTFKGPTNGNPFIDVRFAARFAQGYDSIEVPGFYDGDGQYRVRFMPEKQGA